jgi:hypothetical protein
MFDYMQKRDPFAIAFYCGAVPFGLLWAFHHAVWTAFLLQAYLITMAVFVLDTFEMRPNRAKQRRFWKVMLLTGVLVHPLLLFCLWRLDAVYPGLVRRWGPLFIVAILASILEMVILGETVDRLMGTEAQQDGTGPPAS